MSWIVTAAMMLAFFLVFRRWQLLQRLSPAKSTMVAASVTIAGSMWSLVTEPSESLSFRLHAALLVAMIGLIIIAVRRLRAA